jgi:5-methylcytosine-specific restriction enzyme subunit McrC
VRVLTVRERDLLPFGGEGKLTAGQESALGKLAPALPRGALIWERSGVRVGPFCGVIRAGDLALEILPKIEVGNSVDTETRGVLVAMLRATGDLAASNTGTAALGLQRLHLLDVFILDFCARITGILRGGAIRSYEEFEDDLSAIRGRLHLTAQVRRTPAHRNYLRC